ASTEDFRALLEQQTGRDYERFFAEWFYGRGYPVVKGSAHIEDGLIRVEASNEGTDGTSFHVPLDFVWREGEETRTARIWLDPGQSESEIACDAGATELRIMNEGRVLGNISIAVTP